MKKIVLSLFLAALLVPTVSAFSVNNDLSDQIDTYEGTVLQNAQLELEANNIVAKKLFINPNFSTWREMYLITNDGVYVNSQFNADWYKDENFPPDLIEIKFDGMYRTNRIMLAYSASNIYLSYNGGDDWKDITPDIDEDILFADLGPNFDSNSLVYFITESGLYRMPVSSLSVDQLIESESPGSVKNFRYVRTINSDAVFYVLNGSTILKTVNFGNNWESKTFDSPIKDFEIKQKTYTDGHLMVLTNDNRVYYSTTGLDFYELDMPEEISNIFAVDYIVLTDVGFYITYNNGESWSKLEYDPAYINAVSDYDFAVDGSLKSLFITNAGKVYRDPDLTEELDDYMGDINVDRPYDSSGTATSVNLLDLSEEQFVSNYYVTNAMLEADGDLNGQTMDFYMTADGENWEAVEPGVQHTFAYPGTDLRWKVEMSTTDTSVTPVLRSVNVDYGMEEMAGCAGFPDVAFDDPYCPAIQYVKDQGIFSGYPDGTFGADLEINRAETVKVITEGFNYEILADDGTDLGFSDTELGAWYMGYLNTAKTAGIIEGYPDGTFRPADVVNYAEMMKIFLETADVQTTEPAADEPWFKGYVDYAIASGLTVYEDPGAGMKRADVAQLFYDWSNL